MNSIATISINIYNILDWNQVNSSMRTDHEDLETFHNNISWKCIGLGFLELLSELVIYSAVGGLDRTIIGNV